MQPVHYLIYRWIHAYLYQAISFHNFRNVATRKGTVIMDYGGQHHNILDIYSHTHIQTRTQLVDTYSVCVLHTHNTAARCTPYFARHFSMYTCVHVCIYRNHKHICVSMIFILSIWIWVYIYTYTYTYKHSLYLSLSHTHNTHADTHAHTHTHTHSHKHTCTHTHSNTLLTEVERERDTYDPSLSHTRPHSLSHTHIHIHTHTHTSTDFTHVYACKIRMYICSHIHLYMCKLIYIEYSYIQTHAPASLHLIHTTPTWL